MANIRFQTEIESLNGIKYKVQIYDSLYTGSPSDFSLGSAPIIKFDSAGSEKFNEILASKCELEFVLETNNQVTFWESSFRSDTYTERDVYVFIYQYTDSYKLMWTGYILQDLSTTEDVALPKSILLQAVDGLSVLKEIPFVPNALSAGTSPFTESQTYIPAGTTPTNADSSWGSGGYHRMSFWIAEVLGYAGTASSSLTNASISDYEISISANWYNSKMDATEIQTNDSFFLTAINARQFYKANEASGSNDDVNYNAMSCYDALRNMLRCFGARIFYWGHKFYIIQIGLYSTLETGTDASPVNIKTQIYNKAGVKQSSNSLVGNNNITRYSLTTTSSRPNTPGGLKKLSGTTYDDFPVYKKAMTSFTSVSNLNLFNSFVLIPGQTNNPPSMVGGFSSGNQIAAIDTAFENIGTFTDAKDFTGFFLNIFVKFKNGSGSGNVYVRNNWTIQAKPSSTSSWDTSATLVPVVLVNNTTNAITLEWHEAINFSTFNANTQSLQFRNTYGKASEVPSGHTAKNPFSSKIPVNLGTTVRSVVQDTSIADNFNYVLPTASVMSGDWDFRFFAAVHARPETNLGLKYRHRGHGVQNFNPTSSFGRPPFAASAVPTLLAPNSDGGDISYQVMASNNSYQSAFAVVSGGQIGAYASHTNVTLNTNASYVKQVPDTLWGDTLNTNAPGSLYVDTGSAFEFTNFTGQWGKGVLNGSDSLTELLLKEVLFHNTLKTYKGNFTFSLSNTNRNLSNNSQYPKQISPLTIIKDIDFSNRKFVMLNGGWNLITNEVTGSWFEYKYDSQTTTVRSIDTGIGGTVNTGGGGSIGVGNNDPIDIGTGTGFTPPSPSNLVSSGFINTTSSSVSARLSGNVTDANDGSVLLRSRFGREPFTTTTGVITSGSAVTTIPIDGTLVQADTFKQGDVLIIVDSETEHKFTIATDVAEGATSLTVSSTTLDEDIPPGAFIYPDPDDLYVQYQHKSRGSIGNFAVTSTGMQSGSVNITSYIDDDSFGTASANSLATSESIKAYVDTQVGSADTLQEVTDNGNTTTNSIRIGSSSAPAGGVGLHVDSEIRVDGSDGVAAKKIRSSYFSSAQNITIESGSSAAIVHNIGSSEKMRLNSTGLGIGTSSPSAKLEVAGNIYINGSNLKVFESSVVNYYHSNKMNSYGSIYDWQFAGSNVMRITSNSNLLIGTTTDSGEKLRVEGNVFIHNSNATLKIQEGTAETYSFVAGGTSLDIKADSTTALSIFQNGYVGIGTANPSVPLEVYASGTDKLKLTDDDGSNVIFGIGGNLFSQDLSASAQYRIRINNSEKIRLDSAGNLGINTSFPSEKLHVVGDSLVTGDSHADAFKPAVSGNPIKFKNFDSSTEFARITDGGSVLIGGTTDLNSAIKLQLTNSADNRIQITTSNGFSDTSLDLCNTSDNKGWRVIHRNNTNFEIQHASSLSSGIIGGVSTALAIDSSLNTTLSGSLTGTTATFSGQVTIPATPVASTDAASKGYVDAQIGANNDLQEVTDNGATTTNAITFAGGTSTGDITGQSITLGDGSTDEKLRVYYNDNSYIDINGYGLWFSRSHSYIRPVTNNDTVFHIGTSGNNFSGVFNRATTHYWYNGATEKMRLSNSGGLSIGTSSGGYKLLVSGTGWGGNGIGIQSTTTNGAVLTLVNTQRNFQLASRGNGFSIRDITDSDTERFKIDSSGNTNINGDLTVNGSDIYLALSATTQRALSSTGTDSLQIGDAGVNDIRFKNAVGSVARFLANGNVLIGTTTDLGNKLNVNGTIRLTSAILTGSGFIDNESTYIGLRSVGGKNIVLDSDGTGVGIGTTSPARLLSVNGVQGWSETNTEVAYLNPTSTGTDFGLKNSSGTNVIRLDGRPSQNSYINNGGNLGIGTSSPSASLHVVGQYIQLERSGTMGIQFGKSSNLNAGRILYSSSDSDNFMSFYTNDSEKARITSGGNLLLGTTTDTGFKLNVNAPIITTGYYGYGNANIFYANTQEFKNTISQIQYRAQDNLHYWNISNSEAMRISSNSNLLIGTTTDDGSSKLQIQAATSSKLYFKQFANQYQSGIQSENHLILASNETNGILENRSGTYQRWLVNTNEKMRLTTTGLGIGTSSPAHELQVVSAGNAEIQTQRTSGAGVLIQSQSATGVVGTNTNHNLDLKTNGSTRLRLTTGGNTLLGTTTDSGHKLQVNGDIQIGDGDMLRLGDSSDLKLYHTGTGTVIQNAVGNLTIQQDQNDGDIIFRCDDGSGGTTAYITLDGGLGYTTAQKQIRFADNVEAQFGGIADLTIAHDATNSNISNNTGDFYFKQRADDKDIIFQSDDGTGGLTDYIRIDGSQTTVNVYKNLLINTTTDVGVPLYVNGVIRAVGGGIQAAQDYGFTLNDESGSNRYGLKFGAAGTVGGSNLLMLTNRSFNSATGGGEVAIGGNTNTSGVSEVEIARFSPRVTATSGTQKKVSLDAVLELSAQTTPADPASGKSVIWMDSGGDIKVKINVAGTTVTRTIAAYE